MATFGESNRVRVSAIREATFGTTPATPAMQVLRVTGTDLNGTKETVTSNELRSDRMRSDVIETAASASGSINIELSLGGSFDDLLEAVMCGTWSTAVNYTATDASVAVTGTNTISVSANVAAFSNLSVGQYIYVTGFTGANSAANGWHKVAAVTVGATSTIEVAGTPFTDFTAGANGADLIIKGKTLRNGVEKRSYTIEQSYLDLDTVTHLLMKGMRPDTLSLDVSSGSIVTGSISFMGTEFNMGETAVGTSYTAATTSPVVNATSNVGVLQVDGAALSTAIQSISLQVANNLRQQMAVGSKFAAGIGYGSQTVSGSMQAYFADRVLYEKFQNHVYISLSFSFADSAGRRLRVTLPKIMPQTGTASPGGIDQDIILGIDFTAVLDQDTNCQIQLDYVDAA